MATKDKKIIVIVGVTASGKSSLALKIAQRYSGEIVCADSWTVYKGFDIGAAKPSQADTELVRHHMLDVAEATDHFSAAVFKDQAKNIIDDIHSRDMLPLLVGGNGLYVDSILYDYSFLPQSDPKVRSQLNACSLQELQEIVADAGYDTAGIDLKNKRRVIRLIENDGERPSRSDSIRPSTLVLGVDVSKSKNRALIEQRVELMFRKGLKHEVKELAALYGWDNEAMKGIGYAEFKEYFNGDVSLSAVKRHIVSNSLHLAKRQRTWFKKNTHIVWTASEEEAYTHIDSFLNNR